MSQNGSGRAPSTPARSTRSSRSGSAVSTPSNQRTPTRASAAGSVNGLSSPAMSRVSGVSGTSGQGGLSGVGQRTPTRASAVGSVNGLSSPAMSRVSGVSGLGGLSGVGSISPSMSKGTPRTPGTPSSRRTGFGADIDLRSPLNYGTPSSLAQSRVSKESPASRTPIAQRADINSDRRLRQINVGPRGDDIIDDDNPQLVIWGTDVSANEFKGKFKKFIETFRKDDDDMMDFEDTAPIYLQMLHEIREIDIPFLDIDCKHLEKFDKTSYNQLISYPQEVIPTMDMVVNEMFFSLYPEKDLVHQIHTRPYNADDSKTIRFLNPEDIDQLVTISGMIIRTSNIIPEMKEGYFKCTVCSYGASAEIDRGRIIEPILCPNCNTNFTFTLIHNRSSFVDKQMVRLQEELEDTPPGETPAMVSLFAHAEMVNAVQPGDRVSVTGVYRAAPLRLNPRMRSIRAVYKTHIDVVHFKKISEKKLREEEEGKKLNLSAERVALIKELSHKEDIYERLARAIAPSIYEHEDVKKGILLQLFGGTRKDFEKSGRGHFRAEINILLCGDPGTSKSQLLKYVHDLVPRSQYTSGRGSSAVGLTAYITKDPETRQIVLQTGALVMADNGICAIDEFDKMSESSRSVLHEVMEQQTLSIAKAGIICQLNARASILAAANPLESQWNAKKTIVENVHLPHTLLSRFDLIFLLLDPQSDTYDRRLGKHMISLYFSNQEVEPDVMDPTVLRDYIAYAKEYIHPKLNDDASHRLVSAYVEMRRSGGSHGQISAYPRQLESLIRLAEAHAKVRLSPVVELADVEEAWRLHREAVKQSATDPLSGKIDVSILTTGISTAARKRKADLVKSIKTTLDKKTFKPSELNLPNLLKYLRDQAAWHITKEMYDDAMRQLQDEGYLIMGKTSIKLVK